MSDEAKILAGLGFAAFFIAGMIFIAPLVFGGCLLAAGVAGLRWWKNIGRFNKLKLADRKHFIETTEFIGGLFDFEWNGIHHKMLYLGDSQDGTLRYWYDDGYYYPQAVDDGTMYWDKCKFISDDDLRSRLDGFQEMGDKWPAYYNEVLMADKRKKALKKKRAASKDAATATTEFLNEHPNYMKDLNETVEQLCKEIQGYCPTIDFESLKETHE